MADVIARQMLYALFGMWQMLLPRCRWLSSFVFLADVIANGMWQMFLPLHVIPLDVMTTTTPQVTMST